MKLARYWGVAQDGAVVEVALAPTLVKELKRRWPPVGLTLRSVPTGPIEARFGLSNEWIVVPDEDESGEHPPPEAWDLLESELTLFAVTRLTRLVPVHAAAIAWTGSVLMVPAESGQGKSTLSVAAARAGAMVLTDEFTLVDPTSGLVTGWRRPVRLMRSNGAVDRLELAVSRPPMPVGLVAALAYDPTIDQSFASDGWEPLLPAATAVELLSHTVCGQSRPDDSLDAALAIARSAHGVSGLRGEANQAISELLCLLARRPPSERSDG